MIDMFDFVVLIGAGQIVLAIVLYVVFALAVWRHWWKKDDGCALVWGFWWGLATLFFGPLLAGVYWLIHEPTIVERLRKTSSQENARRAAAQENTRHAAAYECGGCNRVMTQVREDGSCPGCGYMQA